MRVYIAGPMRGYADWNHPAFHKAAEWLEDFGYTPLNPAAINEHLDEDERDHTFADYMRSDIQELLGADAILMLPRWRQSVGATVEMVVAQALDLAVGYAPEPQFMNTHSTPRFFATERPAVNPKTLTRLRRTQEVVAI